MTPPCWVSLREIHLLTNRRSRCAPSYGNIGLPRSQKSEPLGFGGVVSSWGSMRQPSRETRTAVHALRSGPSPFHGNELSTKSIAFVFSIGLQIFLFRIFPNHLFALANKC